MNTTFDIKATAQTFIIEQEHDGKHTSAQITVTKATVRHLIRCLSLWTTTPHGEPVAERKSLMVLPLPFKGTVSEKDNMWVGDKDSQCIEIQASGTSAYLLFSNLPPRWMEIPLDNFLTLIHQSLWMFGVVVHPLRALHRPTQAQSDIRPFDVIVTEVPDRFENYTVAAFRDDCCVVSEYIGVTNSDPATGLKFTRQTNDVMFLEKTEEGVWRHLPHIGSLSVDQARFIAETIRFSVL